MVATEYMKVVNNLITDTRYGRRRVINLVSKTGEKGAVWATDLDSLTYIKPNDTVEVIRGAKGSLSILERETSNGAAHSSQKSDNTLPSQTSYKSNGNGHSTLSNNEEDILDLPIFSQADKQAMATYIKSQARLLRYCYEVSVEQFPEMVGKDERGLRSLAISLLISCNTARDKYKK